MRMSEHVFVFVSVFASESKFAYMNTKLKNTLNMLRHSISK